MVRISTSLAVVTGASGGIGGAVADRLAAAGCRLLLVGRDRDRLDEVCQRTGGEPIVADLADGDGTTELAGRLATLRPDILVNNGGVGQVAPVTEDESAEVERLLAVNLYAPMALTRAVLPGLLARGSGHLVFVTSIAGLLGVPRESAYAASKAALHVFAASLRAEVAPSGIGVTSVAPGAVATEFFDRRGVPYARRIPRPIKPERVAAALVRAIERDRSEVIVPRWLRLPVALQGLAPNAYARLADRAGGS